LPAVSGGDNNRKKVLDTLKSVGYKRRSLPGKTVAQQKEKSGRLKKVVDRMGRRW
jgi:hypothetical protein